MRVWMGYIGSRENGLDTIGKRDLTMNFIENRENTSESGSRESRTGAYNNRQFYRDSQNLIGTGIWAKFLLGFRIRGTPFTPSNTDQTSDKPSRKSVSREWSDQLGLQMMSCTKPIRPNQWKFSIIVQKPNSNQCCATGDVYISWGSTCKNRHGRQNYNHPANWPHGLILSVNCY